MNSTTTRISTNYMLQSTDGKSTWISEDAVKHCQNVRRAIETTRQTAIQVNAADAELKQIVRFCEHYKDGYTLYQPLTQWDQQFFCMEDSEMMDLLMAATELFVAPIMNICFQTLKNKTRQMTLEEKLKACGLCYSILSKDGQMFELTENAAKLSGFISSYKSTNGIYLNNKANPILLDVMAAPLSIILKWCEQHKMEKSVVMTAWDKELLTMGMPELTQVLCAANALDIKGGLVNMVIEMMGQAVCG